MADGDVDLALVGGRIPPALEHLLQVRCASGVRCAAHACLQLLLCRACLACCAYGKGLHIFREQRLMVPYCCAQAPALHTVLQVPCLQAQVPKVVCGL